MTNCLIFRVTARLSGLILQIPERQIGLAEGRRLGARREERSTGLTPHEAFSFLQKKIEERVIPFDVLQIYFFPPRFKVLMAPTGEDIEFWNQNLAPYSSW